MIARVYLALEIPATAPRVRLVLRPHEAQQIVADLQASLLESPTAVVLEILSNDAPLSDLGDVNDVERLRFWFPQKMVAVNG